MLITNHGPISRVTSPVSTTSDVAVSSSCSTYRAVRSTSRVTSPIVSSTGRCPPSAVCSTMSSCRSNASAIERIVARSGSCNPSQTYVPRRRRAIRAASV
jgi:hypothetical protein